MKAKKNIAIKALVISGIALISIEFIFPLLHIAIFGPLWTLSPPFPFKRLGFLFETELGERQVPIAEFNAGRSVSSLAWSSDGKYLLVVDLSNRRLNVYDSQNWEIINSTIRDQHVPEGTLVYQFMPNQPIVLTPLIHMSPPNTISMQEWNFQNNRIVENFDSGFSNPIDNHYNNQSAPITISVSKDGDFIAESVEAEKGDVLIFNTDTSKLIQKIRCDQWDIPSALAFSPDGKTLAVGDCHLLKLSFFDVKSGDLKYETDAPGPRVYNLMSYSPDGTELATSASEYNSSTIIIVRAFDGTVVKNFPWLSARVTNLQWIDNKTVLTSYDYYNHDGSTARIWDVNSGKIIEEFGRHDMELAVLDSNEDRMAVAFGSTVEIFCITK